MITWAVAWLMVKIGGDNGLWVMAGIIGDVIVSYNISSAFRVLIK
jgi:hypothetical protein